MENEFLNYEQALALKELGFDKPCFGYYDIGDKELTLLKYFNYNNLKCISAPLYQQAFRWFREKYGLHAVIENIININNEDEYYFLVKNTVYYKNTEINTNLNGFGFKTYEEGELTCLNKLIEIAQNNKTEEK